MAVDHDALTIHALLRQWSQHHDGYDVERSRLLRAWLHAMHRVAAPLARAGVAPTALTGAGVCAAGASCATGHRHVAPALVLLTAVCDGLDGAVALQRVGAGHELSRYGTAIDQSADRVTDVLFAVALARAGAPRRIALAAATTTLGYESLRSVLRARGRVGAVVTIGERPIRVAVVCAGLMAAPTLGAATVVVLTSGAAAQIAMRARSGQHRQLRSVV